MTIPMNFIYGREEHNLHWKYIPQPYFRRKFKVRSGLVAASLTIGALGYYEVHLNGENITRGELASYRANPDHYIYFDYYDITDTLKKGDNILASVLGNGMQNTVVKIWGGWNFPWRSSAALSFNIELKYSDGTVERVISDENTLWADSPITFNDYYFGEHYDARLEQPGWDTLDFDDSSWQKANPRLPTRGEARICEAPPVLKYEERKPVSITEYKGGYIYDFGLNGAGLTRLHINGTPGQKVTTKHFEVMVDGAPYYDNICYKGCERMQEDEYICAGGEATHMPKFTYHGFRYVYVTGITPEQATPELLTYVVMHSDVPMRGSFKCDNETINKIQEMTVRSDLSNLIHIPTDSPHRERNGWTADAALSAEQMLFNLTPEKLWKEWIRNVYRSMNGDGMIPGIIPTADWGYEDFNGPCWDCVLVYIPYYAYMYRGDIDMLRESAAPLMRYIHYLYSIIREDELIEAPGGLGDWAQVGRPSGRAFKTPVVVTDSILSVDIADKAAQIFDVLGMSEQAEFARGLIKRLLKGIKFNLIDHEKGMIVGNTQTSQALALYYGIVEGEEKQKVLDHLLELIEKDNEHFNVGVIGGRVLFRVLCDNGYADLAFKMIVRPDFPSYGNLVERGATTLWEFFDPVGGKIDSLNHHFWGHISAFFYQYFAGIRVNPNFTDISNVDIKPVFAEGLNHVTAEHELLQGKLSVEIAREGECGTITITCPDSVHGEIKLPSGWCFEDGADTTPLKSGSYKFVK
ncbi:MAG: family 78 glycoside hydrolase catalytic domain [Clostridia bacterium]|nr:family 78 glycoside hydrolase catalytic domain [Clostridia bacterium]